MVKFIFRSLKSESSPACWGSPNFINAGCMAYLWGPMSPPHTYEQSSLISYLYQKSDPIDVDKQIQSFNLTKAPYGSSISFPNPQAYLEV